MEPRALDRRTVTTLVVVALCVLAGLVLVAVTVREAKTLRAQLRAGTRSAAAVADAEPIGEEERTLWTQLDERLRRRYPPEPELPRAMAALAEWSRSAGLELLSVDVQPPPAAAAGTASTAVPATVPGVTIPSELAINGTRLRLVVRHRYRDLVKFVDGLDRLPVYVALQSLETRRADDTLVTELSLLTLRWGA